MHTFSDVLVQYGFVTEASQLDVIRLLSLAGCFEPETLSRDFRSVGFTSDITIAAAQCAVKDACATKVFEPSIILNRLFISSFSSTTDWPEKIHNWFILTTQREWFARKPGQERWQQETGQWMITHQQEVSDIVRRLGLGKEVRPVKQAYDGIVVFGSTGPEMEKRFTFVKDLIDNHQIQAPMMFLLCGERSVDKQVDGDLSTVASSFQLDIAALTETHLMKHALRKVFDVTSVPFDISVIDTPRGILPRPTTLTTLEHLVRLTPDLHGDMLFVSSAPNIQAQDEETKSTLALISPNTIPEIVGMEASPQTPPNRFMGAFAGALYAGYPRVARALGAETSIVDLLEMRKAFSFKEQSQRRAQEQAPSLSMGI